MDAGPSRWAHAGPRAGSAAARGALHGAQQTAGAQPTSVRLTPSMTRAQGACFIGQVSSAAAGRWLCLPS